MLFIPYFLLFNMQNPPLPLSLYNRFYILARSFNTFYIILSSLLYTFYIYLKILKF